MRLSFHLHQQKPPPLLRGGETDCVPVCSFWSKHSPLVLPNTCRGHVKDLSKKGGCVILTHPPLSGTCQGPVNMGPFGNTIHVSKEKFRKETQGGVEEPRHKKEHSSGEHDQSDKKRGVLVESNVYPTSCSIRHILQMSALIRTHQTNERKMRGKWRMTQKKKEANLHSLFSFLSKHFFFFSNIPFVDVLNHASRCCFFLGERFVIPYTTPPPFCAPGFLFFPHLFFFYLCVFDLFVFCFFGKPCK